MKVFVDFLRFSIGNSLDCPVIFKNIDWRALLEWSKNQGIVGILYESILKYGKTLNIPFNSLMEWIGYVQQIEIRNRLVNIQCIQLTETLMQYGYKSCILKGQGNAILYPIPLRRTPGDIDVWVIPTDNNCKTRINNSKQILNIISAVKRKHPDGYALYHHIDLGNFNGVEVEIHYRPSYMNSPIHNKRLQKWFDHQQTVIFSNYVDLFKDGNRICIPTIEYNIIYLLSHMMHHLFSDGIGIKQVLDYYYVIESYDKKNLYEIIYNLKKLGLYQIASAVMYVLHKITNLSEDKMIVPEDKKRGRFLLKEILCGANFGRQDNRKVCVSWQNPFGYFLRHLQRDIRLVRYFPSESLWEPAFRIYHHFWRIKYNRSTL